MHIDTLNRVIENDRVVLRGVYREKEETICYKCNGTGEILATKEELDEFIECRAIHHGWKVALFMWHNWKYTHKIPCPECG